jgi:predicted GNAT family acetyltransferase
MTEKTLLFKMAKTDDEMSNIVNHTTDAFITGLVDSNQWTVDGLKIEVKDGWEIYGAICQDEVVAAIFMKDNKNTLFTKNTPIKLDFQGNGFSHIIKEFYEDEANSRKVNKIINYCPSDNFRMISLNEGHNYKRTGNTIGTNNDIDEWEKHLS